MRTALYTVCLMLFMGNTEQKDYMLKVGMIPAICGLLNVDDQKEEVSTLFFILFLHSSNIVVCLINPSNFAQILDLVLDGLSGVLKYITGSTHEKIAAEMEMCGGVDRIKLLQKHGSENSSRILSSDG